MRSILHLDGDAFFASCEIAANPLLRGKPVVTGADRGIATAMSYEAKARGVTRGMPLYQIKKVCPEAVIVSSNYTLYTSLSWRMFEIIRRYTDEVEEYSIDECFAALDHYDTSKIAAIKKAVQQELGVTFSFGLAPNKVLAKVASKHRKPDGLTVIKPDQIPAYLRDLPIGKIWGIGPATAARLSAVGLPTALDFARRQAAWVKENLSKPFYEIWQELNGRLVYPLRLVERVPQSISKTRTFTPPACAGKPSTDKKFIFAQLSKNVENACIKARRQRLASGRLSFFLKTQAFRYHGAELVLAGATNLPNVLIPLMESKFEQIFRSHTLYRATGVTLYDLVPAAHEQLDLFGHSAKLARWRKVFSTVDEIDERFGKHSVFLGSTFGALAGKSKPRFSVPLLGSVK